MKDVFQRKDREEMGERESGGGRGGREGEMQ